MTPSIAVVAIWRPLLEDAIGLLLLSMIAGVFGWWTLGNLANGVFTSLQGVYRRAGTPVRYWIFTLLVAVGMGFLMVGWVFQLKGAIVVGIQREKALPAGP